MDGVAQLGEYQEVRGTLRLTLRLMQLSPSWFVLTLTVRKPNPEYQRIYWRDVDSTEPSHLETLQLVGSEKELQAARQEYRRIVTLLRFMGSTIPNFAPTATDLGPKSERPKPTKLEKLRASIQADKEALGEKPPTKKRKGKQDVPASPSGFVPFTKGS